MWKDIHEIWLFFKIHIVEKYDPIYGFFNQIMYAYIWTEHFYHSYIGIWVYISRMTARLLRIGLGSEEMTFLCTPSSSV